MAGTTYSRFFWQDWAGDPKLFQCSPGAQALWMRCLCLAAQSDHIGHVLIGSQKPSDADLARITGFSPEDVPRWRTELILHEVCDLNRDGVMISRRMIKDARKRESSVKGGKTRQRQRTETTGETYGSSRTAAQPPLTTSQSPLTTSHPPTPKGDPQQGRGAQGQGEGQGEGTKRVHRLFKALGWSPNDWNRVQRTIRQMCQLEQKGIDLDADLIPCVEAMAAEERIPPDLGSLVYFEKPAQAFRQARAMAADVQRDLERETDAKVAAMSPADWEPRLTRWLFDGAWPSDLGPPPNGEGCKAPPDYVKTALRWHRELLGGRPYARFERNCLADVPIDWPEGRYCSNQVEIDDLKVFIGSKGEKDKRVGPDNVVPLRKAQ